MEKIFFTVTGTNFCFGTDFAKRGDKVHLIKEPENEYDKEAIMVKMDGLGKIGYVANSTHTVLGECMSAGRLYDKIGDTAEGEILYIISAGFICVLNNEPTQSETEDTECEEDEQSIEEIAETDCSEDTNDH